ncbi:MAG: pilus assembly protein PilP [Deltaproteobacteria bacterium]|nr:pilus assembly protein PilP [Deltaproteobacteria bacterium]
MEVKQGWTTFAVIMLSAVLLLMARPAAAPAMENPETATAALKAETNPETFVYDSLGKPDPFRPFINFSEIERSIPTKEPKTPLEKYSLNQFKLVGILLAGKPYAMIEDPEHISYTIREGDHLGNLSGVVEKIDEKEIVVAEPYLDIYDREQIRKVTLKLHVEENDKGEKTK